LSIATLTDADRNGNRRKWGSGRYVHENRAVRRQGGRGALTRQVYRRAQ